MKLIIIISLIAGTALSSQYEYVYRNTFSNQYSETLEQVWGVKPDDAITISKNQIKVYEPIVSTNLMFDIIANETNTVVVTNQVEVPISNCRWEVGASHPRKATDQEIIACSNALAEIESAKYEEKIKATVQAYRMPILGVYSELQAFTNVSIAVDGYAGIMVKSRQQIANAVGDDKSKKLASILMAKTYFKEILEPANIKGKFLEDCIYYALTHPEGE
jgi:hypothetical protein